MSSLTTSETPIQKSNHFPKGIPFIVGNEAAERFSFYGMRAILFVYMSTLYLNFAKPETVAEAARTAAEARATQVVHLFQAAVYAFPMIGAIIADRLIGKYRVIFWVSFIYCAGHAVLAVLGRTEFGMYLGLSLIAIGSGGIKPVVSANVGDQFTKENSHLIDKIYQIFYFSINFGSFFSQLLTPWLYDKYGPEVAFGVPGVLMGIATVIFWMGRNRYIKIPPKPGGTLGLLDTLASVGLFIPLAAFAFGPHGYYGIKTLISLLSIAFWFILFSIRQKKHEDSGFLSLIHYCMRHQHLRKPGMGYFDVAREKFGDEAAEGPPAVFRIAIVFSMVSVFWSLYDQHASSWVNQAQRMNLDVAFPIFGTVHFSASQISALNPIMIMVIIPFLNFAVYPILEKLGVRLTPIRKMTFGMFLPAVAFVLVALLQMRIDSLVSSGQKVGVMWQFFPYLVMTTSEVLVSAVGLEFAYTQAPRAMKSTIMGLWLLTITFGNLLVAFMAGFEKLPLVQFFWIFAGLMTFASIVFAIIAYFYKEKTYLQDAGH